MSSDEFLWVQMRVMSSDVYFVGVALLIRTHSNTLEPICLRLFLEINKASKRAKGSFIFKLQFCPHSLLFALSKLFRNFVLITTG